MSTRRRALAVAGVVLGGTLLVHAQSGPLQAPKGGDKAREDALRELHLRVVEEQAKRVCAMRVIPADPEIDGKSLKKAPADKKYTMRKVTPELCGTDSRAPNIINPDGFAPNR